MNTNKITLEYALEYEINKALRHVNDLMLPLIMAQEKGKVAFDGGYPLEDFIEKLDECKIRYHFLLRALNKES